MIRKCSLSLGAIDETSESQNRVSFGLCMRAIIVLMGALMISACAGEMLPGNIYSTDGKVMQFEIEKSRGSGAVKAVDASTGEQFAGTYVGVMPTVTQT
jgi:hypothetical protein